MIRLVLAVCLALLPAAPALAVDDLLDPEKAFRFSARMVDANQAEGRFQVAKGYYLYKDKIKFSADGVRLGRVALPAGKVKQDEIFGAVETFAADFGVRIPVEGAGAGKPFFLTASFQGCAEAGVCYAPQEVRVQLVATSASAAPASVESANISAAGTASQDPALIARLKQLAFGAEAAAEPEFLSPEEAFRPSLSFTPDGRMQADFTIAPGYYLYRDKTTFVVQTPAGTQVTDVVLPPGVEKEDPYFGRSLIYPASFSASARLENLPPEAVEASVLVQYQGCNEGGICYPPTETLLKVRLPTSAFGAEVAAAGESESDRIAMLLGGGGFWLAVVSFFGFGLLLALTPCVFPMIPILSGIIVGQGSSVTKTRGFVLSLAYVLGMAITYALAGVAAGLSGTLISNALQNAWALGIGAAIFVALALSMFGFYELQLPNFLQSRFSAASNRMRGGGLLGVFGMGVISALIVGPCVAAPLAGALLYIGQSGDVVLGGTALFSLALGMGVPLLLIGISAGALLPRAGAWMEAVKGFFGVLMLAVALWLVAPLLDAAVNMLLWAALLAISGIYLRAVDPLDAAAGGWMRLWKGVGVLALAGGIALLAGVLGGSRDLLQPLAVFKGGAAAGQTGQAGLAFRKVSSPAELDAAIAAAAGRPVMLDFYADWCVSCKEMERFTFSDAAVQARLRDVVLLKADVTANSADDRALLARFNLFGPPGIVFFDAEGREQRFRVIGFEDKDAFLQSLDRVLP